MFYFLKYINPMWYYRLQDRAKVPLYSDAELDELHGKGFVRPCRNYMNAGSVRMDMAFQALQAGIIPHQPGSYSGEVMHPTVEWVTDNYVFTRRHFPLKWSLYILIVRILTMHNPFKEVRSFLSAKQAEKAPDRRTTMYEGFNSHFIPKQYADSLVSVIIPTLDRYEYLKDVLDDLERQDHERMEVIVCDQSEPFNERIYENRRFPVKVIRQPEKALWKARNTCFSAASGDFILLFDDDSRVANDWVRQHLRCLSYFDAKISAGVTETTVGNGLSPKEGMFHLSDVFDTGNAMVAREVFEKIGLFDRQFEKQRMGDGEFGLRAYLGGYNVVSNPFAKRVHLKAESGGLRHFGGWDAFRPGRLFAPRPIPSVLYFCRRYFGNTSAFYLLLNSLPSSVIPYRFKGSRRMKRMASLLIPIMGPILIVQAAVAWRLSGKMLDEGPRIDFPVSKRIANEIATASN